MVLEREEGVEQSPLQHDALRQGRLIGGIDHLLGQLDRIGRQGRDLLGRRHGRLDQVGQRHDTANQSAAFGLGGIHHPPGQDHVHGLGLADEAGQALGASGSGRDAQIDLGLAELGIVSGDDEVAHHGQLAATAQRKARDRRNDGLAAAGHGLPIAGDKVFAIDLGIGFGGHLLNVGPGGKGLVRAGNDDTADASVRFGHSQGRCQVVHQLIVKGVQGLWPVEADQGHALGGVNQQGLVGRHGQIPMPVH